MESWRAGLTALFVLIDAAAFVLNLSILIVTLKTTHLRQTQGNNFVINLIGADLLVTMIVMPIWISDFAESYWIFPEYVCNIYGYIYAVLSYDTIWTTCLISCDRYYSIAYPMLHAVNLTLPRSLVAILSTWLLSGFCAALPSIYHEDSKQVYQVLGPLCVNRYSDNFDIHWIVIGVLCYCIPATILLLSYFAIFRIARKIKIQVMPKPRASVANSEVSVIPYNPSIWPSQQVNVKTKSRAGPPRLSVIDPNSTKLVFIDGTGASKRSARKQTTPNNTKKYVRVGKAARTVICISGLFIGLWMPYFVTVFRGATSNSFNNRQTVEMVAAWLAFLTYLANPIVYGHFNQPIRYELKRWLCACSKNKVPEETNVASPNHIENFVEFLEKTSSPESSQDGTQYDKF